MAAGEMGGAGKEGRGAGWGALERATVAGRDSDGGGGRGCGAWEWEAGVHHGGARECAQQPPQSRSVEATAWEGVGLWRLQGGEGGDGRDA